MPFTWSLSCAGPTTSCADEVTGMPPSITTAAISSAIIIPSIQPPLEPRTEPPLQPSTMPVPPAEPPSKVVGVCVTPGVQNTSTLTVAWQACPKCIAPLSRSPYSRMLQEDPPLRHRSLFSTPTAWVFPPTRPPPRTRAPLCPYFRPWKPEIQEHTDSYVWHAYILPCFHYIIILVVNTPPILIFILYLYSYITTHHPLSHRTTHHLLSHHLHYKPHTHILYS